VGFKVGSDFIASLSPWLNVNICTSAETKSCRLQANISKLLCLWRRKTCESHVLRADRRIYCSLFLSDPSLHNPIKLYFGITALCPPRNLPVTFISVCVIGRKVLCLKYAVGTTDKDGVYKRY
jgi:hypothetical protein